MSAERFERHAERLREAAGNIRQASSTDAFEELRAHTVNMLATQEGEAAVATLETVANVSVLEDRVEAVYHCAQAFHCGCPQAGGDTDTGQGERVCECDAATDRRSLLDRLQALAPKLAADGKRIAEHLMEIQALNARWADQIAEHRETAAAARTAEALADTIDAYGEGLVAFGNASEQLQRRLGIAGTTDEFHAELNEVQRLADALDLEERIDSATVGSLAYEAIGGDAAVAVVALQRGLL